jgi:hypothetical protein
MFITLELLEEKRACLEQRGLFQTHFPDGFEVTVEGCVAVAGVFDWGWAAEYLLPYGGYGLYAEAYLAALKVYHPTVEAAWEVFYAACEAKQRELPDWDGADYEAYSVWRHEPRRVRTEATNAALAVLKKARATAFATQALRVPTQDSAPARP